MKMKLANRCLIRKIASLGLITAGVTLIVINLVSIYAVSPLLGIALVVLGVSWLMSRELSLIHI